MADAAERVEQLREGITGAAAALPEEHAALGSRAASAADRLAASARGPTPAAGPEASRAVPGMERLHYALLRVTVLGDAAAEAGLEEALAELESLAGEAPPAETESPGST